VRAKEFDYDESLPDLRYVTTLRVNHLFTRSNEPRAPARGRIGNHVDYLTNGSLRSRPMKLLTTPNRYKCGRSYRQAENASLFKIWHEKIFVLQIVAEKICLDLSNRRTTAVALLKQH
jgi:hypothetical protein